jgi:hypothetical protein
MDTIVQSLNFESELALNVFHHVKFDCLMVIMEELVSFWVSTIRLVEAT